VKLGDEDVAYAFETVIQGTDDFTDQPQPVEAEVFIVKVPPAAGTVAEAAAGVIAPTRNLAEGARLRDIATVVWFAVPPAKPLHPEKQYPDAGVAVMPTLLPWA
jgi:hypothetical protein